MARPRPGTVLALLAVAAMIGLWTYLFLIADPGVTDQLDDPAFAEAAAPRCERAQAAIDDLPDARDATSPEDRAPAVAEANEVLDDLVADLRSIAPAPTGEGDGHLVDLWLDDWETYLQDRHVYADALADGEDTELLVTGRGGEQITLTMDHFADVNDMVPCQVPLDA
jgi:hypothetical protein